jgi:HEAT repeat protein
MRALGIASGGVIVKNKWTWISLGLVVSLSTLGIYYWPTFLELLNGDSAFSHDNRSRSYWLRQLKQRDPVFRQEAVGRLGEARDADPEVVKAFKDSLNDEDVRVRHMAAHALADVAGKDKTIIPRLIESIGDRGRLVRLEVVQALGRHGAGMPGVVEALMVALHDQDVFVTLAAIQALGRLGAEAKPARDLLQDIARGETRLSTEAIVSLKLIDAEHEPETK